MIEINWPTFNEWLAELRSPNVGDQNRGHLKREDGSRCCLGVLCDMAGLESEYRIGSRLYKFGEGVYNRGSIPDSKLPGWMTAETRDTAISMNDDDRCTFTEIADRLEKLYKPTTNKKAK